MAFWLPLGEGGGSIWFSPFPFQQAVLSPDAVGKGVRGWYPE